MGLLRADLQRHKPAETLEHWNCLCDKIACNENESLGMKW